MDKQTQKELLAIVRRNYDEIADDFNETRKKYLWPELVKLTRLAKEGGRVLDVGCGNGRLTEAFLGKNIAYLGLDQSEKLLKHARRNYPDRVFRAGNVFDLNKEKEIDFDVVFCVAVLHHLPGRDLRLAALRQLKNKIKPDGRIVIVVWNLWRQPAYRRLIRRFFLLKLIKKNRMDFGDIVFDWKNSGQKGLSRRYYHAFSKRELKKLFKKAGLRVEKLYRDSYNYYAVLQR